MAEAKGRCLCGKVASLKAIRKHAAQCASYRAMFQAKPDDPSLDLQQAQEVWLAGYDSREIAKMEARGAGREVNIAEREAERRSRWQSGSGQMSVEKQVPVPRGGSAEIPIHLVGSARGEALAGMQVPALSEEV